MDLNEAQIRVLPDEDKQELAVWTSLLESGGYKLLTEFLTPQAESTVAVLTNAGSWEQYQYARGYRDALNQVLNLRTIIEETLAQKADAFIEEEPEGDAHTQVVLDLEGGAY